MFKKRKYIFILLYLLFLLYYNGTAAYGETYSTRSMNHFMSGVFLDMSGRYAEAILEYQDAALFEPNVPVFYLSMAENYTYLDKFDNALAMYEKYLQLKPDDYKTSHLLLTKFYLPKGDYKKAEDLAANMQKRFGESTSLKLLLTDLYLRNNKIQKGVQNISDYLTSQGVAPNIHGFIVKSFIANQQTDLGIEVYKRFADKFIDNDKLFYGLGLLYIAKNDTANSVSSFEKCIELSGNARYATDKLSSIYLSLNRLEEGRALFDDVGLKAKIEIADAYFYAKKDKEAENLYARINDEHNDIALVYFRLGELKYHSDKYREAVRYFTKSAEIDTTVSETYFRIALAYYKLEEYTDALSNIDKCIGIRPDELRFLNLKADIVYKTDDFKKTEDIYNAIFDIDPEYENALNNYSYILAERGEKLEKALEMSKRAVAKKPDNSSYLDTLGWIYYKLNRFEDALKYLREAADLAEKDDVPHPAILEHLGDNYMKLGDIDKAQSYWKKALELDNDNKEILKKIQESK